MATDVFVLEEGGTPIVWLQKISIPTLWMIIGNSKGVVWGVSKAKMFKGKSEVKPEFLEGWGVSKAKMFKGKCATKPEFQKGWGGGNQTKNHL